MVAFSNKFYRLFIQTLQVFPGTSVIRVDLYPGKSFSLPHLKGLYFSRTQHK